MTELITIGTTPDIITAASLSLGRALVRATIIAGIIK
jgi:hypothetical protein